ncbi:hypothetical protein [Mucilaginibacter sp. BT774]|uniref:hypothetical protein n=1 Tax=Mucilaginibacter sp. BT774 TaxID=3062276 RepID=UPI002674D611|nr:hypothetical protein [Mucilaginibacter sp. BT774]MDO3628710.1 hypothetical protein [Mucilaginibacter sp. BT774]
MILLKVDRPMLYPPTGVSMAGWAKCANAAVEYLFALSHHIPAQQTNEQNHH